MVVMAVMGGDGMVTVWCHTLMMMINGVDIVSHSGDGVVKMVIVMGNDGIVKV